MDGGSTRHGSEWNALSALAASIDAAAYDVVAIHDGARPLATAELWSAVIEAAAEHGGAIPGRVQPALVTTEGSPAPGPLVGVQTPQAFRASALLQAYDDAAADGFEGTDTAACLERYAPQLAVAAIAGDPANLKITYAEDLRAADRLR